MEKELAYKPLKVVRCPECQEEQSTKDLKLKTKFGFSSLRQGLPDGDDGKLLEMSMWSEVDKMRKPPTRP